MAFGHWNNLLTEFFEYVYGIPFRTARDYFWLIFEYVFLTHPKHLFEHFLNIGNLPTQGDNENIKGEFIYTCGSIWFDLMYDHMPCSIGSTLREFQNPNSKASEKMRNVSWIRVVQFSCRDACSRLVSCRKSCLPWCPRFGSPFMV